MFLGPGWPQMHIAPKMLFGAKSVRCHYLQLLNIFSANTMEVNIYINGNVCSENSFAVRVLLQMLLQPTEEAVVLDTYSLFVCPHCRPCSVR